MSKGEEGKVVDVNLFRKNKKLKKDSAIDEVITKLVLMHKSADEGLKEISEMCFQKDEKEDGR